jgi:S1-C subfamily serine protease
MKTHTALVILAALAGSSFAADALDPRLQKMEQERIAAIEKARPAVVSIFSPGGQGGGSGVVIDENGYVLTNFHVVSGRGPAGANVHMQCGLSDGFLYDSVLVGIDKMGDVAMVRLLPKTDKDGKVIAPKGGKFPFAKMGDSDKVRAGDWSMAMGNPFLLATDFAPTVTFGLVSGVHRYQYPEGGFLEYADCIQIDTSINPGNSGGPLFNMDGELIGINGRGSFDKRGRVNSGVGYAISINQIKNFEPALRAGLETDHASTGFLIAERAEDGAAKITVTEILPDSDAERRGISTGDLLISFAGRPIESRNNYVNILGTFPRGWRMPLKYRHDNETRETLVRLMGVIRKEINDPSKPNGPGPQPIVAAPPPPPAAVAKMYEAKPGFANFYFNKQERDRLLKTFASTSGNFKGLTGAWTIKGEGKVKDAASTVEFKISEEKDKDGKVETTVRYGKGGVDNLYVLQPLKTGLSQEELETPPGSGGLLVALMHYRQMLALAEKGFPGDGFWHGGVEPFYPDGKTRVDCEVLCTKLGAVPAKWYFSKKDATLQGGEVSLVEREKDPCELYFTDYKKDAGGRLLPQKIEVRYGKDRFAQINVTTFEVK